MGGKAEGRGDGRQLPLELGEGRERDHDAHALAVRQDGKRADQSAGRPRHVTETGDTRQGGRRRRDHSRRAPDGPTAQHW